MKQVFVIIGCLLSSVMCFGQTAQMPNIIVFPSDTWMADHAFVEEVNDDGKIGRIFNYDDALLKNRNVAQAIQTVQKILEERQFKSQDLAALLKKIAQKQGAEMAAEADGHASRIGATTRLMQQANPDIRIDLDFHEESFGPTSNISYSLKAVDAYTSGQVASTQGTIQATMDPVDLALRKGFSAHCDDFCQQLIDYYTDLRNNGRKVIITVRADSNSSFDFMEGEFGPDGDVFGDYLQTFFGQYAVNQSCDQSSLTSDETELLVRIPMFDETGKPVRPRSWANKIIKSFQADTGKTIKLENFANSGLGQLNFKVR